MREIQRRSRRRFSAEEKVPGYWSIHFSVDSCATWAVVTGSHSTDPVADRRQSIEGVADVLPPQSLVKYTETWAKLAHVASGTGATCDAPRFVDMAMERSLTI